MIAERERVVSVERRGWFRWGWEAWHRRNGAGPVSRGTARTRRSAERAAMRSVVR